MQKKHVFNKASETLSKGQFFVLLKIQYGLKKLVKKRQKKTKLIACFMEALQLKELILELNITELALKF